jgi:hypothetical protein
MQSNYDRLNTIADSREEVFLEYRGWARGQQTFAVKRLAYYVVLHTASSLAEDIWI